MIKNILIVEDEEEISDLIELYLKNEGYKIFKSSNGSDALKIIHKENIDLAILDIMLPDISGFDICREIRSKYKYPIIMLTAKDAELDKINGLTLGADDYITKPFRPLELVARVKAHLRRYTLYNENNNIQNTNKENILSVGGLVIDKNTHKCFLNEKPLHLTPTEFSILWVLCKNKNQVISSENLFMKVWKDKYFTNSNNTIMVHIRHIREKMNDPADNPKYIKTVWGVGYKIEE